MGLCSTLGAIWAMKVALGSPVRAPPHSRRPGHLLKIRPARARRLRIASFNEDAGGAEQRIIVKFSLPLEVSSSWADQGAAWLVADGKDD